MSETQRLANIQSHVRTLELLSELLVQHDDAWGCEDGPELSARNLAGVHRAIKTLSHLVSDGVGSLESRLIVE